MGHLLAIQVAQVSIGLVGVGGGVRGVGQSVAELHQGGVGSLTYALVVVLAGSLAACAPLVVGQCIDDFGSHDALGRRHAKLAVGQAQDVVEVLPRILDGIVEVGPEQQRHDVVGLGADAVTVATDTVGHHVEVEPVGTKVVVGLVDTGVEGMGLGAYLGEYARLGLQCGLELFCCHGCGFLLVQMYAFSQEGASFRKERFGVLNKKY